ncbi:hypothetical protein [Horticoccus sp. 23ND18S-11]|uniref:hypothetical protein n=1 Tax=Horticoccus sp. 23ND18S-11 TaxID=3391832 RepID=UPI0039C9451F
MHTSVVRPVQPGALSSFRSRFIPATLLTLVFASAGWAQGARPNPGDVTITPLPGGGGIGGGIIGGGGGGITLPIFPGNPGGGGTINLNEPRIVTAAGLLVGQRSEATLVIPTLATAPTTGTGTTSPTTYQWTVGGGRITGDPARQTITFTADTAGTVSLNVVFTTNGTSVSTSTDVTVLSPALAGTITVPATTGTATPTIAASVPAAQSGDRTFRWSLAGTGAAIATGQGTNAITLRPGAPGLLEVMCDVTLQRVATVTLRSFVLVTGAGAPVALTVNNGAGGGTYPAGTRVDLFAQPPPAGQVFDQWTGDVAVLGTGPLLPLLPHVVATIPTTPATLTATYKPAAPWTPTTVTAFNPIATTSPTGTTLLYHIPGDARGLVFLLHDNGGSAAGWFSAPESFALARDLVAAGYGVAALSSVNRTAGTWSTQATLAASPDAATLAAALDRFARDGLFAAGKPIFLLGHAAGADAAARYAQQLAAAPSSRAVRGVVLFCATGGGALAVTSPVPTFFALAAHDDLLGDAGLTEARDNSQLLAGRGITTNVVTNAASPVPASRLRMLGLTAANFTAADAQAIWSALKAAAFLDANNYPRSVPAVDAVRAVLPVSYQARAADVAAQLAVAYASQEFYSDANVRVINFLNGRAGNAPSPAPGRLVNLSTRSTISYLGDALTLGFTISGTQRATLLIRGVGPALARFGVPGALSAPRLEVTQDSRLLAANEGWSQGSGAAPIAAAATAVGAFPLAPGDADCALLVTLDPGSYTAAIKGINGATGDVLAEVYDVSRNATRLTNLSAIARISNAGGVLVPGIVVAGANPRTLVVRAVGPGLAEVGVAADTVLADPRLQVFNGNGQNIATNNNWSQGGTTASAATLAAAFPAVGAFALRTNSADAALVDALAPGAYTLQAGATPVFTAPGATAPLTSPNATGIVMVEVYEVP